MTHRDTPLFPLLVVTQQNDLKEASALLGKSGFKVSLMDDLNRAGEQAQKSSTPLIILDQDLEGQGSQDVFTSFKSKRAADPRQVLLVCGNGARKKDSPVYDRSFDDLIARPLNPGELLFRVTKAKRIVLLEKALVQAAQRLKQAPNQVPEPRSPLSLNLETLGRLAAGVIHEINTPIQYVGDNLHFLLEAVENMVRVLDDCKSLCQAHDQGKINDAMIKDFMGSHDHEDLDYLKTEAPESIRQSIQGVERISEIVLAIRNFSSQSQDSTKTVDIHAAVKSCVLVTKNEWKKIAGLETDLSPDLPEARMGAGAFNQVMINLIINAAHAIEEAVSTDPGRKGLIRISANVNGPHAEIRVSDNGTGIPEAVRAKIFDPFFTTKKEGKGTGQGLAITKSIIEEHKGQLSLETQPGKGTTFVILIPLGQAGQKAETLSGISEWQPGEHTVNGDDTRRRILFVDDEIEILNGIQRMLRSMQGTWDMHFTQSGRDALVFLEINPVDVVVSDFSMKEMNGLDFLTEVKTLYPQVIRMMLSGEVNKSFIMKTVRIVHQFIAKPCDADTLKNAIIRACDLKKLLINDDLRRTVANMDTLPSLPTVYAEITRELRSKDASMKKIGQLIGHDTAMTTKILQLVNSAFFSLPTHISSPDQAVMLLGFDTVKALVLHYEIFSKINVSQSFRTFLESLSRHNMEIGNLAKRICEDVSKDKVLADQAFMGGLLHDCGKLILASNFPKDYAKVLALAKEEGRTTLSAEQEIFGTSHSEVGAYLTGIWGFPLPLVNAIFHHHDPLKIEEQAMGPATAVYIANAISGGSEGINWEFLSMRGFSGRIDHWKEMMMIESD